MRILEHVFVLRARIQFGRASRQSLGRGGEFLWFCGEIHVNLWISLLILWIIPVKFPLFSGNRVVLAGKEAISADNIVDKSKGGVDNPPYAC
jgi:hypothetical protein